MLAVIALLVGAGIMAGGALFGRAGVASLTSNIKDLAAASRSFKARYSYFPGDLPNAAAQIVGGTAVSPACNYAISSFVGNGVVDTPVESDCALEHLVRAGMISKVDHDGTRYVIRHHDLGADVRVSLWYDSGSNVNAIRVANLPCETALEIDRRLDSATSANTPFIEGSVRARDTSDAPISTCVFGSTNDPVPTLLIRY